MKIKQRQSKLVALVLAFIIIASAFVVGLMPAFADNGEALFSEFPGADIVNWFVALAWYWQMLIVAAIGVVIGLIIRGLGRR